jgi:carbon-monoxide dehydrogenase small subunit
MPEIAIVDQRTVRLTVNGAPREHTVPTRTSLGDFLRRGLGLTGTHLGCEHGVCGACTVLVDGEAVRSCLMLAVQAHGRAITTVEGLARADGELSLLQRAFRTHHGLQCGYCTPGVLVTLTDFLARNPDPSRDDVREALTGNLCRCTGYKGMVDATMHAAAELRAQKGV